ncbi:MAG: DUF5615 family PIN-like protein [Deltaproteobacteria bacterium]|nr:DUF5615 family PIN-like protein [Deltaproteobacteria bacterium]
MRFKLDENADPRWREPLERAGFGVSTVSEEGLRGTDDERLAEICCASRLCLVTADLDFAQILHYPPEKYAGLIVLRHRRPTVARLRQLVEQVAAALTSQSPVGRLWIVEPGRIRIHEPSGQDQD